MKSYEFTFNWLFEPKKANFDGQLNPIMPM
jgi:hypothetical protein